MKFSITTAAVFVASTALAHPYPDGDMAEVEGSVNGLAPQLTTTFSAHVETASPEPEARNKGGAKEAASNGEAPEPNTIFTEKWNPGKWAGVFPSFGLGMWATTLTTRTSTSKHYTDDRDAILAAMTGQPQADNLEGLLAIPTSAADEDWFKSILSNDIAQYSERTAETTAAPSQTDQATVTETVTLTKITTEVRIVPQLTTVTETETETEISTSSVFVGGSESQHVPHKPASTDHLRELWGGQTFVDIPLADPTRITYTRDEDPNFEVNEVLSTKPSRPKTTSRAKDEEEDE